MVSWCTGGYVVYKQTGKSKIVSIQSSPTKKSFPICEHGKHAKLGAREGRTTYFMFCWSSTSTILWPLAPAERKLLVCRLSQIQIQIGSKVPFRLGARTKMDVIQTPQSAWTEHVHKRRDIKGLDSRESAANLKLVLQQLLREYIHRELTKTCSDQCPCPGMHVT